MLGGKNGAGQGKGEAQHSNMSRHSPHRCVVAAGRGGAAGQRWRASCERLNSPRPLHTPNASPLQQHHQLQIQQEQTQQLQQVATALRDTFRLQNYPGVDVSEAALLHVSLYLLTMSADSAC